MYTVLKGVEHRTQLDTSEQPGYKMNLASIHLAEPSLSKMLNPPSSKSGLIKEREREKKNIIPVCFVLIKSSHCAQLSWNCTLGPQQEAKHLSP